MILDALQERHRHLKKWVAAHHRIIREGTTRARRRGEPGKTIGIRLPDDIREQLRAVQKKHGLRSYRKTVIAAVVVGLRILEAHAPNEAEAREDQAEGS